MSEPWSPQDEKSGAAPSKAGVEAPPCVAGIVGVVHTGLMWVARNELAAFNRTDGISAHARDRVVRDR
ncbi:MAG: hypothetical protein ABL883_04135 [Terricaulis sp.]